MNIVRDITNVPFKSYSTFSGMLDFIWRECKRNPSDLIKIANYVTVMGVWRRTINKKRMYSSSEMSIIEKLNYNRAIKDIDSLLFRLRKISGVASVSKIESGEQGGENDEQSDAKSESDANS